MAYLEGDLPIWGRNTRAHDLVANEGKKLAWLGDSPFPSPQAALSTAHIAAVQKHFDAARRLFEACPVSTQLRLSAAPCVTSCGDILATGDAAVLIPIGGAARGGSSMSA